MTSGGPRRQPRTHAIATATIGLLLLAGLWILAAKVGDAVGEWARWTALGVGLVLLVLILRWYRRSLRKWAAESGAEPPAPWMFP